MTASATKNPAGKDVQNEVLASVRKGQEAVIDGLTAWADSVKSITPDVPAVPGLDKLPKPEEVVRSAYDFAEKVLAGQREFAEKIAATTAGLLPKN